jgi:hypothetical protein
MTDQSAAAGENQALPSFPWLLKPRRNEIFLLIERLNLNIREFELVNARMKPIGYRAEIAGALIVHKPSLAYLFIWTNEFRYLLNEKIGERPILSSSAESWWGTKRRVRRWLAELTHDLSTPDLWTELEKEIAFLNDSSDSSINSPFSAEEQEEIAGQLKSLANEAKIKYKLSEADIGNLNAKLDYLISAAARLGRIDWRNAFAGAMLGLILSAAIPSEAARYVILSLFKAVAHLYDFPQLPSP